MTTLEPLRVPTSIAAKRGVSWLAEQARDRRVLLTRFGQPTAAIDSAERLDESSRLIVAARREVVESLADAALDRAGPARDLDEVCARLGLDIERVRARSKQLAAN